MQQTSARALPPGTMIAGSWRIERMLGEGGFAVTYEAHNATTGAHVALKEYMPAGCCNRVPASSHVMAAAGKEGEVFHWGRERFMKEAETLARLDHPAIVRVAGYFEANGTAYMALAYEAGGTLKSWLARLGRTPTQAELDVILWPLLDALKEVHSLFLLHRDIKPDNILMRGDGTPVLIDFGATRSAIVGHTATLGGVNPVATSAFAIVSHGYSPPEQYDPAGRMVGPVSDVYALAATLYASLTGAHPPAATSRQFGDPFIPLEGATALHGYRAAFLAGIDQALTLNPKDRPQSAMEFRRAIGLNAAPRNTSLAWRPTEAGQPGGGSVRSAPSVQPVTFTGIQSTPKRTDARPRSRAWLVAAAAVALAMLGGGGWWVAHTRVEPAVAKVEADRRVAEENAVRLEGQARAPRLAEEKAKADADARAQADAEARRIADLQKTDEVARKKAVEDEAKRKADDEARRRDSIAALTPGSGQSARDRLADGAECAFCPEMVVVPAGRFTMGAGPSDLASLDEVEALYIRAATPARRITFARPIAVMTAPVSRAQFAEFARQTSRAVGGGCESNVKGNEWTKSPSRSWSNPGFSQTADDPVVCVSWEDAKAYVGWLAKATGQPYRLPSEAEREFFTRAGTQTRFWNGEALGLHDARFGHRTIKSPRGTAAPSFYLANPWGLLSVHGNVWEWVEDHWTPTLEAKPTNGAPWLAPDAHANRLRVVRGGSWNWGERAASSASRGKNGLDERSDDVGFRLVRTISE